MATALVSISAIPRALRSADQWVVWKYETRDGKRTKVPYNPHDGRNASSTDPETWSTFADALLYHRDNDWTDGVGLVVTSADDFVGIDLDHCRDDQTGKIEPWARAIVDALDSYTEITPSNEGLRIFVRGRLPEGGRKRGNVEMYESGRYLTVTGRHLDDTPLTVEERDLALRRVHRDVWPEPTKAVQPERQAPRPVDIADAELVVKARSAANGEKFSRLWDGNTSDQASGSEADLALCGMLAFWTGGDSARIDSLFRNSGLYRPKWDEVHYSSGETYGQHTVAKVVDEAREFYTPPGQSLGMRIRLAETRAAVHDDEGEPAKMPEAKALPRLVALTSDEVLLGEQPEIPWLISAPPDEYGETPGGLLAERETFILGADSGAGKTWLLADLIRSAAMGVPWFGHFQMARPLKILLVDEESSLWLLRQRWAALLRGANIDPLWFAREVFDQNIRIYQDQGFSFDDARALDALHEAALAFRPDIVLCDTLARVHRRPENDNSEIAGLFEENIKPFKRSVGCGLGFAHHLRKASKDAPNDPGSMLRGASDLKGQLDEFWYLRGKTGNPRGIFEHDKCRAMPELPAFGLMRERDPDGGVRIVFQGAAATGATVADINKDVILRFLIDNGKQSKQDVVAFGKTRGMSERVIERAIAGLVSDEEIDRVKIGRDSFYWASETGA